MGHLCLQWRATRDFQDLQFLGPRIVDKVVLALIIMTLYWKIGDNRALSNYSNLTAVLFLWTILPGYAATAFIPTIVLERPLFVRCAAPVSVHSPRKGLQCRGYLWLQMTVKAALEKQVTSACAMPGTLLKRRQAKLSTIVGVRSERNDGLYRPITYLVFKMMEELIIVLCNSLVLSAVVFYPLRLSGDFTLFWLVFLTTSSIGIGAPAPLHWRRDAAVTLLLLLIRVIWFWSRRAR